MVSEYKPFLGKVPRLHNYYTNDGNVFAIICSLQANNAIGLVRGIDMKEKLFYITTPEPIHRLEQVNCLMLGKNELPSSVYMCSKKHCNDDTHPYVTGNLPKMAITKPFQRQSI